MERLPDGVRAILWDLDLAALDLDLARDAVLARVLEHGRLEEVRWAVARYGHAQIRDFFRAVAHPLITPRTRAFWRAYYKDEQAWPALLPWRTSFAAPWPGSPG